MSSENGNTTAPEGGQLQAGQAPVPAGDTDPNDSVHTFIRNIGKLLAIDMLQRTVRATPYGLFVADDAIDTIVESYRDWLSKMTEGAIHKSSDKCRKRLFGTFQPKRKYLIEGKQILAGSLIECKLPEPHRLGVPHFLGSLTEMHNYIHPRDPVLLSLSGVATQAVSGGLDFIFSHNGQQFRVGTAALTEFGSFASRSSRLVRQEPLVTESLSGVLKLLIELIRTSRPVREDLEFVVPWQYRELNKYNLRSLGSITFVFDKRGSLLSSYDLGRTNLVRFIKREFMQFQPRQIGSFEILGRKDRALGCFHFGKDRYTLSVRAFIEFFNLLRHSPDKRERFTKIFTVRQCFDKFSDIFQMSVAIDRHKVGAVAERWEGRANAFRINGNWIFMLTRNGSIEGCVAKHIRTIDGARSSGHSQRRHSYGRGRSGRRHRR